MLQPNDADIRREPCRMPVGPNRAPGLAVTAFCELADRVPKLCFSLSRYMYKKTFLVAFLIPTREIHIGGGTDCVERCAHYGNIIRVRIKCFEAIDIRQICESH